MRTGRSVSITKVAAVIVVSMLGTGCYSTWDIAPKSLATLDGFHVPEARPLVDMRGDEVTFDGNTELNFVDTSGAPKGEKFAEIHIAGSALTGTTHPNNYPFTIDLKQVNEITIKRFSWGKTALLVGIIVAAVVLTPIVLGIIFGTQDNSGN